VPLALVRSHSSAIFTMRLSLRSFMLLISRL
jgi:hypothetical protein